MQWMVKNSLIGALPQIGKLGRWILRKQIQKLYILSLILLKI